jgi:VWFA-related protein
MGPRAACIAAAIALGAVGAVAVVWAAGAVVHAQQPFRSGVDVVRIGVTVVDKQGNPIAGLTAKDFEITENRTKQAVRYFAAGEAQDAGDPHDAAPLHLGLLLDESGSMADDLDEARSGAVKFVNALNQAADVTLVSFDTEVRVARFGADDYPRLVERIRSRDADGFTALYDALGMYLDTAQHQDGQKVLVLYTDGGDTTSAMTFGDALNLLKESDVTVYAVGYLQHQSSTVAYEQRSELQRFAEITGGQAYFPSGRGDLKGVFDTIAKEVGARYSLGYVSTDTHADGKWRDVQIKLLRKDLKGAKLRTRAGYFAPYKPAGRPKP